MLGVVAKAGPGLSFYGNYVEGLSKGDTAPSFDPDPSQLPLNAGQSLDPYVSRQKEIGVKFDGGRLGTRTTEHGQTCMPPRPASPPCHEVAPPGWFS